MSGSEQNWEAWDARLRAVRGAVVGLAGAVSAWPADQSGRPLPYGPSLELPPGTRVRYAETRYDAMRLEEAHHLVRVESGPDAGRWAHIPDVAGPGPLPWEAGYSQSRWARTRFSGRL